MLSVLEMLLTNHNRPKYKLIKLKALVIHWTANTNNGANAIANRNFFNSTTNSCSAHIIIDDKQIVRCLNDNEVGYHVGSTKYTTLGTSLRGGTAYSPNYFTVGIEMCVNSDGDWNKTYQNTVEFSAKFLIEHKLTVDNLLRHYDITGKLCPQMMIDENEWKKFKNAVQMKINEMTKPIVPKDELREAIDFLANKASFDASLWYINAKSGKIPYLDAMFIKIAKAFNK